MGFQSNEAGLWRNAGLTPDQAAAWKEAGVGPDVVTSAALRGGLAAERHGLEPPPSFSDSPVPVAVRRDDWLFGSPRSAREVSIWLALEVPLVETTVAKARFLQDMAAIPSRRDASGARYATLDIPGMRAAAARGLGSAREGWELAALRLAYTAIPYLIPADYAMAQFEGEPLPPELLSDLRLPFQAIALLFDAEFLLPEASALALPTWDRDDAERRILTYDPGWSS